MLSLAGLAVLFAAGCGGEKTDISNAVKDSNKSYSGTATFKCPDTVDGGEGTKFNCTLKGTKSGKSATINLKVTKDGIAPVNQKKFESTLQSIGAV